MSDPFAKLFDTPHGQLLVFMDDNEQAEPVLRVIGAPVRGVRPATSFGGWDSGSEKQRAAFEMTDQEQAEKLAAALHNMADRAAA